MLNLVFTVHVIKQHPVSNTGRFIKEDKKQFRGTKYKKIIMLPITLG